MKRKDQKTIWKVLSGPSWILFQAMTLIVALVHWTLVALAPDLEPMCSTFVIGGVFGLSIPPLLLIYVVLRLCFQRVWLIIAFLFLVYIVRSCLDKTPFRASNRGPALPVGALEKAAEKFWNSSFRYFPMRLTLTENAQKALADESRRFLFAVHPHSIHCWPLNMLCFTQSPLLERFPHLSLTGLCASVMFYLPVIREVFLSMGYVDASRRVAQKSLEHGSIFVCTGGEREAMATTVGVDHVVLKNRKGFIRLAMATPGVQLVPVFGFGVSDLYTTYTFFHSFRNWLQRTASIAIPLFHGRSFTPLPYRLPVNVVIGDPIVLPTRGKGQEQWPTPEALDEAHANYIAALKEMHRKYAPPGRRLEIV